MAAHAALFVNSVVTGATHEEIGYAEAKDGHEQVQEDATEVHPLWSSMDLGGVVREGSVWPKEVLSPLRCEESSTIRAR